MGIISFAKNLKQIFDQRPKVPAAFGGHRLVKAILDRRSVRRFLDQDIKDEEMDLILEAGRLAPSTVNMQTWSFGVFSETTWKETFGRSIPFNAKRAVVVLGDITRMKRAADVFLFFLNPVFSTGRLQGSHEFGSQGDVALKRLINQLDGGLFVFWKPCFNRQIIGGMVGMEKSAGEVCMYYHGLQFL